MHELAARKMRTMTQEQPTPDLLISDLLGRSQAGPLPPPIVAPPSLPFGDLDPLVFERLVGEVVWLVDGMNDVRGYGRPGQDQGGLDLIGRLDGGTHVYQVRRIVQLTAAALKKAVEDFAGPSRVQVPETEWIDRRFRAVRFVLATACSADDTAVEDQLVILREKYAGDLEIDLYDGRQLSRMLRERGSLVGGIFGPDWACAFCGYDMPHAPVTPAGRALLNDPLLHLGLGEILTRAEEFTDGEPARAAELFAQLAQRLDQGFPAHAEALRAREREMLLAAGNPTAAFTVTMRLLLDRYETGDRMLDEPRRATELAATLGSPAIEAATVATALDDWFERGYDLGPVTQALKTIVDAEDPCASQLVVAVAEQIVTDEDPADDPAGLTELAGGLVGHLTGMAGVRLECCLADLSIRAGVDPVEAYRDLTRRALGGYISEPLAGLVHMRSGRALAFAGCPDDAIEAYRRAVLVAATSDNGGDARDALRSISFLSSKHGLGFEGAFNAMRSARSVGSHDRLISSADDPAVSALEALVDGNLPDASREAHRWVRQKRVAGALLDELVARRRYGEVFARAGVLASAVRQFVMADAQDQAVRAASAAPESLEISQFLDVSANWVQASAAAVIRNQADLLPDSAIDGLAARLVTIAVQGTAPSLMGPQPEKEALGALGAFDLRLPISAARNVLPLVCEMVPREPGHYRFADNEMLAVLAACAHSDAPEVATSAIAALVDAMGRSVHLADRYVSALGPATPGVLDGVRRLAADGDDNALITLAGWDEANGPLVAAARSAAQTILSEPVGTIRSTFSIGSAAERCALLLRAAVAPGATQAEDTGEPLTGLLDRVVHHLLFWAEDRNDLAVRRASAVAALRILADRLPSTLSATVWRRLIELHDDPGANEQDLFEQQSQHPLSRFRVDSGGQHLAAGCLLAAAATASTIDEAVAVEERLLPALAKAVTDPQDSGFRAATVMAVNPLRPLPLRPACGPSSSASAPGWRSMLEVAANPLPDVTNGLRPRS